MLSEVGRRLFGIGVVCFCRVFERAGLVRAELYLKCRCGAKLFKNVVGGLVFSRLLGVVEDRSSR